MFNSLFSDFKLGSYITSDFFEHVQLISETFIHTSACVLGILLNIPAIVIWFKDKAAKKKLRIMAISAIVADQMYLMSLITFMSTRPRGDDLLFYNGSLTFDHFLNNSADSLALRSDNSSSNTSSTLDCSEGPSNVSYVFVEKCDIAVNTTNETLNYDQQLEIIRNHYCRIKGRYSYVHYITAWVGTFQCFSNWMLYMCASEANKMIRTVVFNHRRTTNKFWPGFIFFCIALYFTTFISEVRILVDVVIYGRTLHNYELMPFLNHWDFVLNETCGQDLFYILFYSLTYTLNTHILPYVMIVSVDKSIFDALHESQRVKVVINDSRESSSESCQIYENKMNGRTRIPSRSYYNRTFCQRGGGGVGGRKNKVGVVSDNQKIRESILYPSLVVSITCTVYLICVALKMIILIFKSFEFVIRYLANAQIFFGYLNVYANFIQILKATVHLPIVIMYNKKYTVRVIKYFEPIKQRLSCCNEEEEEEDFND